jgi:hypothetical protein
LGNAHSFLGHTRRYPIPPPYRRETRPRRISAWHRPTPPPHATPDEVSAASHTTQYPGSGSASRKRWRPEKCLAPHSGRETLDQAVGAALQVLGGTQRRAQVENVIRTSVNHVASQAREALYAANTDVIKGVG